VPTHRHALFRVLAWVPEKPLTATDLQTRFAIPGALNFDATPFGLPRAIISTPQTAATVYLHGAHVTDWTPRGQRPVLFTSSRSLFESGKPIRGGVPLVFPWFGPRAGGAPGPMHGFARIMEWNVESAALRPDGAVEIRLALSPNHETRQVGYASFHLQFRVVVGATLEMGIDVRNPSDAPLRFEQALHSYFAVADIHQVSIAGLAGTTYVDKTNSFQRKQQPAEPIAIAKETDQVHLNTASTCVIHDPVWRRRIVIEKSGSQTTVVWNPWIEKNRTMADMAPDDWQSMLCVETANALDNAITLPPAAVHQMSAAIRVE
jgi:glucose-6-phosphate 1-epimerase